MDQQVPRGHASSGDNQQVVVVMVPLPAQGHLNQLLQLSRLIASYNIPVHYVGTATHNRQVRLRAHGCCWDSLSITNIHFHEFPAPSYPTPPPNPNAAHKFPSQLIPLFKTTEHLREPVSNMVLELSGEAKRVVVIYDSLMAWVVQDVLSIPRAERYCFNSVSALTILSFHLEASGKPVPPEIEILNQLPSRAKCIPPEFLEFSTLQRELRKFNSGNLYNSNKLIEGLFLDQLAKEHIFATNKQWAIGPFNPVETPDQEGNGVAHHKCLEWLDTQAPKSVVFVSFGTTTSLTDEQIRELAIGLEKSEQKFIWVLREADKGDVFVGDDRKAQLPEGYEQRIQEKQQGIIVRDWAPQLQILGHNSTGGFMSHCGWNSCMESITMGVPIAAWPMHSDQPFNAVLITKVLKLGLIVEEWAPESEVVVPNAVIERAVRRLMDSADGEEMRKRATELRNGVRESVMEGGVTRKEMDSFIAHITR